MALENPAPPHPHPAEPAPRSRPWRALRAMVPFVLVAAALLAISQVLWLWYSWPVRHVLDDEQFTIGASS